tara:strand:- start:254 stop:535 length:282 start_codon:yes stop_codon:yes gene_type:complete
MFNRGAKKIVICISLLVFPLFFNIILDDFNWSIFDFAVMGFMLFFVGIALELVSSLVKGGKKKEILYGLIILLFLLLWAELGVGIFNSPISGD